MFKSLRFLSGEAGKETTWRQETRHWAQISFSWAFSQEGDILISSSSSTSLAIPAWSFPSGQIPTFIPPCISCLANSLSLTWFSSLAQSPKWWSTFSQGRETISLIGRGAQIFFTLTPGIAECLLLTLIAYDRYVATCHPLKHSIIISHWVFQLVAVGFWVGGALAPLVHTAYAMHVPLCGSWELYHLFLWSQSPREAVLWGHICLWERSSSDQHRCGSSPHKPHSDFLYSRLPPGPANELPWRQERGPGCCSSHLTVVTFYYAPAMLIYMRPDLLTPLLWTRLSLFDTILTSMLNPLIYRLRNREVVGSIRKMLRMHPISDQAPMSHWVDSSELRSTWEVVGSDKTRWNSPCLHLLSTNVEFIPSLLIKSVWNI